MNDKEIKLNQLKRRKKLLKKIIKFGKSNNAVVWCEIENLDISETDNIIIKFIYFRKALLSEIRAINKSIYDLTN